MTNGQIRICLRQAIARAIQQAANPSVSVFDTSPRVVDAPSVQIVTTSERMVDELLDLSFSTEVLVELVLREVGAETQRRLDELAHQVERGLGAPFLEVRLPDRSIEAAVSYESMRLALDSQQEDRVGTMVLTYRVRVP